MESTDSSGGPPAPPQPKLPPGFRFHPTDEELVVHYLKRKAASAPLPVAIIAEVDLYKFDPWELPAKAAFGEQEWYFFSPRDRKYPNGARPNRAATSGYWKATGTDKPILAVGGTQKIGVKKALVFYGGKPPKGIKTNWIMHEYRLADNKACNRPPGCDFGNKKNSLRLDDWVLCRIYKKNNTGRHVDNDKEEMIDDIFGGNVPPEVSMVGGGHHQNIFMMSSYPAKNSTTYGIFSDNDPSLYDHGVMNNITSNDNNNNNNDMGLNLSSSSSGSKTELPMMMSSLKRALPAPYWPATEAEEVTAAAYGSPSKRFHADISSLLAQTPPQLVQQPAAMFRTSYQLSGLNEYS